MSSSAIQNGACQAVAHCVCVQPHEKVTIITDRKTRYLAQALADEVFKLSATAEIYVMEDFGSRGILDAPLAFSPTIGESLSHSQASFYIAQCKPGEFAIGPILLMNEIFIYHLVLFHGIQNGIDLIFIKFAIPPTSRVYEHDRTLLTGTGTFRTTPRTGHFRIYTTFIDFVHHIIQQTDITVLITDTGNNFTFQTITDKDMKSFHIHVNSPHANDTLP